MSSTLLDPSALHWLGTDHLGRDTLSRLIAGSQTALFTALESVGIAIVIGVTWGLVAGYFGGVVDRVLSRLADIFQSISGLLLALVLVAILGNNLHSAMLALGIVFSVNYMRITRALVVSERSKLYVTASEVIGVRHPAIAVRHIFPNILPPLIVETSIIIGLALLLEAMLSFIGMGAGIEQISWGSMLNEAKQYIWSNPLQAVVPGLVLTGAIFLFNIVGDIVRDEFAATGGASPRRRLRRRRAGTETTMTTTKTTSVGQKVVSPTQKQTGSRPDAGEVSDAFGQSVLEVEALSVSGEVKAGHADILSDVGFSISAGEVFGLVGESGSGKSVTAMAILGLLANPLEITSGRISFQGNVLSELQDSRLNEYRGARIGYVSQDPMAALSPVHTIGQQLQDPLMHHMGLNRKDARVRAIELLQLVGVPDPERRIEAYPHELSGGMAQRVVIAGAISCDPALLIADEPTTALDVTVQLQILDLLQSLVTKLDMSMLLISHDLGVIANMCDRVGVMYAGRLVEVASVHNLFSAPKHPYTHDLILAAERAQDGEGNLLTIEGKVPPATSWPSGCRFHPRCEFANSNCAVQLPRLENGVACLRSNELNLKLETKGATID
jgi:peptide/nickel transport system permease protein